MRAWMLLATVLALGAAPLTTDARPITRLFGYGPVKFGSDIAALKDLYGPDVQDHGQATETGGRKLGGPSQFNGVHGTVTYEFNAAGQFVRAYFIANDGFVAENGPSDVVDQTPECRAHFKSVLDGLVGSFGRAPDVVRDSLQDKTLPGEEVIYKFTDGHLVDAAIAGCAISVHYYGDPGLTFSYTQHSGDFLRLGDGVIADPQGFLAALRALQPPPGAHGAYGMLGDDSLMHRPDGYGLSQLGAIARKYVRFDLFTDNQPKGFEYAGVQSGFFLDPSQINDATLGWWLFDLRPQFEADLAQLRP